MSEQLHVEATSHPHQYIVHNVPIIDRGDREFNDVYVNFGGYFGRHGPQVFAAAPEMLEALMACVEPAEPGEDCPLPPALYNKVCAAIAKATGE